MIQVAESDEQIARTFAVMHELRPHLLEAEYVNMVRRMMAEGYQLVFVEEDGQVRAVAGFRRTEMLHRGRSVYIDDLVTMNSHRSRGFGRQLLQWVVELCRAEGIGQLHLDSGVQRAGAHRFYFREGMHITSFHFAMNVTPAPAD